jgi:hypothetical protein
MVENESRGRVTGTTTRVMRTLLSTVAVASALQCTTESNSTGPDPDPGPDQVLGPIVSLDASTRYQTISGWEATAQAGQSIPAFSQVSNALYDMAVNDLGITRVRLEVYSGAENDRDYWSETEKIGANNQLWVCTRYSTINDNSDPFVINSSGFHFAQLEDPINKVVKPIKQRVEARGDRFHLNVTYVAFVDNLCSGRTYIHNQNPEEYAEFVLATYQHLRTRHNLTPDSWELVLEPSTNRWSGTSLGQAAVAAANRLRANGFTPRFVAPSFANLSNTFPFFDQMVGVNGFTQAASELSYHRYGGASTTQLQGVASRAGQLGISTSMLEHIGSDYNNLHTDLTVANVSSWQQFALAYNEPDDGSKYIRIDDSNPSQPRVVLTSRARFLRQYFRYIRPGAVRIRTTSADGAFNPVAFINANNGYVVVIKASRGGPVSLQGLPAGTYGVSYALSDRSESGPDVQIGTGRTLNASIPAQGVLTVYRK